MTDDLYQDGIEDGIEELDENSSFADLRKAYKRATKQIKAYEAEVEPLREFKQQVEQERKVMSVKAIFDEVGLSEKQIPLFLKEVDTSEVDADVVKNFAAAYDLPTREGSVPEPTNTASEGFNPIVTGTATPPGMVSMDDVKAMINRGENAAVEKLFAENRVIKESVPWTTL